MNLAHYKFDHRDETYSINLLCANDPRNLEFIKSYINKRIDWSELHTVDKGDHINIIIDCWKIEDFEHLVNDLVRLPGILQVSYPRDTN